MKSTTADRIREYARRTYVEPARKRGEATVRIVAGDIHKALNLKDRAPNVCSALRSKKFQQESRANWKP